MRSRPMHRGSRSGGVAQKKSARGKLNGLMTTNQNQRLTLREAVRQGFANYQELYRATRRGTLSSIKRNGTIYVLLQDVLEIYGNSSHNEKSESAFLGIVDIASRWGISSQAVHKRIKEDGSFPQPAARINKNKTYVFKITDIKKYENVNAIGVDIPRSRKQWFTRNMYDHGFRGWKTGHLYYEEAARAARIGINPKISVAKKPVKS
jgi:hypothetical protein